MAREKQNCERHNSQYKKSVLRLTMSEKVDFRILSVCEEKLSESEESPKSIIPPSPTTETSLMICTVLFLPK